MIEAEFGLLVDLRPRSDLAMNGWRHDGVHDLRAELVALSATPVA
jgi:hypothetical protein